MMPASRRRRVVSSVHPQQHGTTALINCLLKNNEAERTLVLATCKTSAQAMSQRAEALVEAFILSKKLQPWYTLLLLLVPGMHYVQH